MEIQLLWLPNEPPQLSDIKQQFIMHTESVGQEFGQGIAGTACLCSLVAAAE